MKHASLFALGGMLAGKAGNAVAAQPATAAVTKVDAAKRIGLQIYSLGPELDKDVPGGMKRLKQMGYQTLELAGYNNGKVRGIDMMEFKKMADDAGLEILSSHVNPPVREYTKENLNTIKEYWKKTADDHAKMGAKYLVQPGQPSTRSVEETKYVCEVFNEAGKIVKAAGLPFGYHNHDMEFAKVVPGGTEMKFGRHNKGEKVYDIFLANTDPSLVFFEMDVYWVVRGQNSPVDYINQYPGRFVLLHIKDNKELGQSGMVGFDAIFKNTDTAGTKHLVVEVEQYNHAPAESVKMSLDYLLACPLVKAKY